MPHEPLTRELVASCLKELQSAFGAKMDEQAVIRRAEVYRDNLQGVSGEALRWACKRVIQEDVYFPKVARLRALATQWAAANVARGAAPTATRRCPCGRDYVLEKRYRPASGAGNSVKLSADRKWVLLVEYTREVCSTCHPKSPYWPDPLAPTGMLAMPLDNQLPYTLQRRLLASKSVEAIPAAVDGKAA